MATSFQRRPDAKAIQDLFDPKKQNAVADLQKVLHELPESLRDAQKQGAQKEVDAEVSADVAAQLQPSMGNHAVQALLKRAGEQDAVAKGEDEQEQQEEEQGKEEGEDKDAQGVERVLPSFSAGGGGPAAPPWAMSHYFGGDDDDDGNLFLDDQPRWRPMPVPPDPDDEDVEFDEVGAEAPPNDPDAVDMRDADLALGRRPWEQTLLSRGLRWPARLARAGLRPELLVDQEGGNTAFGRARTMLRFLAVEADDPDVAILSRAAVAAGEALLAEGGGFSGAVSRNLAMVEVCLTQAGDRAGWERVLELRLDTRARPRAENAAATLGDGGQMTAEALVGEALGVTVPTPPGDDDEPDPRFELVDGCHPALVSALTLVIRPEPIPALDVWSPSRAEPDPDDALSVVEAAMASFLGVVPGFDGTVCEDDLASLYDGLNALLTTLGAMQAEICAAVLASWAHADADRLTGIAATLDHLLRDTARRLVEVGQAIEARVDSVAIDEVVQLSVEAVAIRNRVELIRRALLASFGAAVGLEAGVGAGPRSGVAHPALDRAWELWEHGRGGEARAVLQELQAAALPGRARLGVASLLLTMGYSADSVGVLEAAARELLRGEAGEAPAPELALGALILMTGLALGRGEGARAERLALTTGRLAARLGLPYAAADAAMSCASARAAQGLDWRDGLLAAAEAAREGGDGGPFNLIKARWAELSEAG